MWLRDFEGETTGTVAEFLFLPGVQIGYPSWPWWRRGVLRNGIGEYADDMSTYYGIDLRHPPDPT